MQIPAIGSHRRHYKSTGGSDHTYEVIGIAKHSETNEELVVYKPLYDATSTRLGNAQYAARPVHMWHDVIERQGKQTQRFTSVE